jgi:hypothetical protein
MAYLEFPPFPKLPEDIKQEILSIVEQSESVFLDDLLINSTPEIVELVKSVYGFEAKDSELGYTGEEARKKFPGLVNYHFLDVSDNIKKWVEGNIPVKADSINIQVMEKGSIIAPHIDEIRTKAYNYLIQTGGDVSLVFYELANPEDSKWVHPQIFIPYEKIVRQEETKVPVDVWHILPTNKIHGVENINPTNRRISLSISVV